MASKYIRGTFLHNNWWLDGFSVSHIDDLLRVFFNLTIWRRLWLVYILDVSRSFCKTLELMVFASDGGSFFFKTAKLFRPKMYNKYRSII